MVACKQADSIRNNVELFQEDLLTVQTLGKVISNETITTYLRQMLLDLGSQKCSVRKTMSDKKAKGTELKPLASASEVRGEASRMTLFVYMRIIINRMKSLGKIRTAEAYTSTLNSFCRFRQGVDIELEQIVPNVMIAYEIYLRDKRVIRNSSSFYMRILRAVYNRAVVELGIDNKSPFKYVYVGVDKTKKRAVSLECIKKIKQINLNNRQGLDFARDMFLFSFYTRGMSFVDMAYLRNDAVSKGELVYYRRKTGNRLSVKWESCMQKIVDKYRNNSKYYLLPIIKNDNKNERKQYINCLCSVNRNLKIIGRMIGLDIPLTMYVARHSWASIAKKSNVPLAVISEGMGHSSETTTQIYLAAIDSTRVDRVNSHIINMLK